MKRGDRFVAYHAEPIKSRLFIEVTRVARDGKWADIKVRNCYVMWTKRQRLNALGELPACVPMVWDQLDLDEQDQAWIATKGDQ